MRVVAEMPPQNGSEARPALRGTSYRRGGIAGRHTRPGPCCRECAVSDRKGVQYPRPMGSPWYCCSGGKGCGEGIPPERNVARATVEFSPFHVVAGEAYAYGAVRADGPAWALTRTGHAPVAERTGRNDGVRGEHRLGHHKADPLARAELRGQEHLAIAHFSQSAQEGGDSKVDHHVWCRPPWSHRSAVLSAKWTFVVHGAPVALMPHGEGFEASVLENLERLRTAIGM